MFVGILWIATDSCIPGEFLPSLAAAEFCVVKSPFNYGSDFHHNICMFIDLKDSVIIQSLAKPALEKF